MMTKYEKTLGTVPCFRGLCARDLRVVARLVDVVVVPAGTRLAADKRQVIVAVEGGWITEPNGSIVAVSPLRLYLFGWRELLALLEALPDRALSVFLIDDAMVATCPHGTAGIGAPDVVATAQVT